MKRPKKQHYIPQLHLRHFTGLRPPGMLWTYDLLIGTSRPSLPKETATETNFYSVQDENGQYIDAIEKWLQGVETKAAPIYEQLLNGKIPQAQERMDFSTFIASLYSRTPAMRRIYGEVMGSGRQFLMNAIASKPDAFEQEIRRYEAEKGPIDPEVRERMRRFILNKQYTIDVDHHAAIPALNLSDTLQGIFFEMGWAVVGNDEQHLITCDQPVVRVTPRKTFHPIYGDGGFLNKHVTVTVPLSPNRCLVMGWHPNVKGVLHIKRDEARLYNQQRAYFAERYLYSSIQDDGIRRLGEKHKTPGMRIKFSGSEDLVEVKVKRRLDEDKRP